MVAKMNAFLKGKFIPFEDKAWIKGLHTVVTWKDLVIALFWEMLIFPHFKHSILIVMICIINNGTFFYF